MLRTRARGHRDLVTVVGHAAMVAPGEWITASGEWVNDRAHGRRFRARFMRTSEPSSVEHTPTMRKLPPASKLARSPVWNHPSVSTAARLCTGAAADSSKLGKDGKPTNDRFLKPGDIVEIKNPVIGTLRTKIVKTQK